MRKVIFLDEFEDILNVIQNVMSGARQEELIVSRDKCITQRICAF